MEKRIKILRKLNKERNQKLYSLYETGNYSYNSLGRMFKITGQRVGQIINKLQKAQNEETSNDHAWEDHMNDEEVERANS